MRMPCKSRTEIPSSHQVILFFAAEKQSAAAVILAAAAAAAAVVVVVVLLLVVVFGGLSYLTPTSCYPLAANEIQECTILQLGTVRYF
jgi:ABC-type phosphate transport system auxiliary subunit